MGAGGVLMETTQRLHIGIDGNPPKPVTVGAFAQIAAKRVYGMQAFHEGDPEPILFGVWIELHGPRPRGEAQDVTLDAFDKWLQTVTLFELAEEAPADDDEDPTPAESSGSSLVSPPTSE